MNNPQFLLLKSLNYEFEDYEYEMAGIDLMYIFPAGELAKRGLTFKRKTDDSEMLLTIVFKDKPVKIVSLSDYSMSFLY